MHRFTVPISKLKALRSPEVKKKKKIVSGCLEELTSKNGYLMVHKASRSMTLLQPPVSKLVS